MGKKEAAKKQAPKKSKSTKKEKDSKKDENAPKRPLTAFFWFMKTRREALKKEEPDL